MKKRYSLLATLSILLSASSIASAGEATKEKPLAQLKLGEKVYTKVYVSEFDVKTGKVMLEHEWGAKGINIEKLTKEQKEALGVKSTLSATELEKNRSEADKKHQAIVKADEEELAAAKKQKATTSKATSAAAKYKRVVTKRRVG